ncbi:MAG: cyclic nucleotide-binding domain-containing protein [Mariprofundaceae bacterium]
MSLNTPHEKNIAHGTVILREGELNDGVYIILQGHVIVSHIDTGGQETILAELNAGEVFGEMGLVSQQPCSATVSAAGEVRVQHFTREQFVQAMSQNFSSVEMILSTLFRRMRHMNLRVVELEQQLATQNNLTPSQTNKKDSSAGQSISLTGITEQAKHALDGVQQFNIESFPFIIGRWAPNKEKSSWFFSHDENDLDLHDIQPYSISRQHCRIEKKRGKFYLSDESRVGTWVDGKRYNKTGKDSKILLEPGLHSLALGSSSSPFTFRLIVR